MNWIFFLIGDAVGLLSGIIIYAFYYSIRLYGRFIIDNTRDDKTIFRLEFTKNPKNIKPKDKFILFKIESDHLNEVKDE